MADIQQMTIHQMWQTPYVKGLYNLLSTPDMVMQKFYGTMLDQNREFTPTRTFGWDLFNPTRTLATVKQPMTAPTVIKRLPVGHRNGRILRVAEKQSFYYEEFMNLRPMGTPWQTPLDQRGEAWVARQIKEMTRRHRNLMEYTFSKMLQGGFGIKESGEFMYITDLNASGNTWNIDMGIPADHLGTLGGIIDVPWDNPAASILMQLTKLRQRAIAESGYEPAVAWTDSRTLMYMMRNLEMMEVRGMNNQAWSEWDWNKAPNGVEPSDRGQGAQMSVRFAAFPHMTFFANDALVSTGTATDPQGTDSYSLSDLTRVVPAGKVIFTPPAGGEWYKIYESAEPVKTSYGNGPPTIAKGFFSWDFPVPNGGIPPQHEAGMLDNFCPVLVIPKGIWVATVRDASNDVAL